MTAPGAGPPAATSPGRAAYTAAVTQAIIDGHGIAEYPAYDHMEPWQRERWEASGQAAAPALTRQLDCARQLCDDRMDEVHDLTEERDSLTGRVAELHALATEIINAIEATLGGKRNLSATDVAKWRARKIAAAITRQET